MIRLATLELKNFLAGRGVAAALALICAAGMVAIEHGRRTIAGQEAILAASPQTESAHLDKLLRLHSASLATSPGEILYYRNFFTRREPSQYAPVALGLRDVTPFNLKVRILALEGQLYDSEIANPEAQALGNFDLAFLLGFLYPLLIVSFLHNVLSTELESGTWNLLSSLPFSRARLLGFKAALRFVPVLGVWLATVAFAVLRFDLPLDRRLAYWLALSLAYLVFWFALSLLVAALGRSSTYNALALLSTWLGFAVLIPVSINLAVAGAFPASSAFEVAIRQREGYHNRWDRPRIETIRAFYSLYPQHAAFAALEDRFSWAWYYAMQHMGDVEASAASTEWRRALEAREIWSRRLSILAPPALIQSELSRLAATGLGAHLAYLDSVRTYHERLRRHFYPFLFREEPAPPVSWSGVPAHRFTDESLPRVPIEDLSWIVIPSLAMCVGAATALRRL